MQQVARRLALAVPAMFFLVAAPASTSPVPADAQSLLNGSDLYTMHCSECHGWGPMAHYSRRFEADGMIDQFDYSDLVDEVHGSPEEKGNIVYVEDEAAWPEWAEFPDPGDQANDPDVRREIMQEMAGLIDEYYGEEEEIALEIEPEFEGDVFDEEISAMLGLGPTGRAVANDRAGSATNLMQPGAFIYGTAEQDLYNSIARGGSGGMPAFADLLESEEALWDLVNFIRSLWPEQSGY